MKSILLCLILSAIMAPDTENKVELLQLSVLEGSRISIAGSSNINTFNCASYSVEGKGSALIVHGSGIEAPTAYISLLATSLDCGSGRMNRDMYKALKTDLHPLIEYELLEVLALEDVDGMMRLTTRGQLIVAGSGMRTDIVFDVSPVNEKQYHIAGSKVVAMTDFDIKPPKALFGLIKARNELEIQFVIIAGVR